MATDDTFIEPDGWRFALDDILTNKSTLMAYPDEELRQSIRARLEFHIGREPSDEEIETAIGYLREPESYAEDVQAEAVAKREEAAAQREEKRAAAQELATAWRNLEEYRAAGFEFLGEAEPQQTADGEWYVNARVMRGDGTVEEGRLNLSEFQMEWAGPTITVDTMTGEEVIGEPPGSSLPDFLGDQLTTDDIPYLLNTAPFYTAGLVEPPQRESYDDYMAFFRVLDPDVLHREEDLFNFKNLLTQGRAIDLYNEAMGRTMIQTEGTVYDDRQYLGITPKYRAGDDFALFQNKSAGYKAMIQAKMIQAGLLTKGDIRAFGEWTFEEADQMKEVMQLADARGEAWQETLDFFVENPLNAADGSNSSASSDFVSSMAYQAPDWATLKQTVKNVFRNQLGREPRPAELQEFIHELDKDYSAAYQSDYAAARDAWYGAQNTNAAAGVVSDSRIDQMASGVFNPEEEAERYASFQDYMRPDYENPNLGVPGEDGDGAGGYTTGPRQVDPFARFKEQFDAKYQGEIDRNERVALAKERTNMLRQSLAGLSSSIGGYRG